MSFSPSKRAAIEVHSKKDEPGNSAYDGFEKHHILREDPLASSSMSCPRFSLARLSFCALDHNIDTRRRVFKLPEQAQSS